MWLSIPSGNFALIFYLLLYTLFCDKMEFLPIIIGFCSKQTAKKLTATFLKVIKGHMGFRIEWSLKIIIV